MTAVEITFGVILCVLAVALVVCVMLQSGKEKSLSGTITGAGESFFGKSKGKTKEKAFARATTILSFVFAAVVVAMYVVTNVI
ncbi:MAG: preprotein translocase subunit SecG [Clostridia bacterium]|nr:preprotein translocase subunit SecG [Clostridia bacterium]